METVGRTGRVLWSTVLLVAWALLMAPQRTPAPLPPDPATNLVRTRALFSTTATTIDLSIDGARLANALFTLRSADSAVRASFDGNILRIVGNARGSAIDVEIDMILAGVIEGTSVAWNVDAGGTANARLDIVNINGAPMAVDTFVLEGNSGRFRSSADLLRRGGPLGKPSPIASRLVLAFFYPWWNLETWSNPIFIDRPMQPYTTDSTTDLTREMTQARNAGLDALVVSWSGKAFDGGIDNRRMLACLTAGQSAGIKIATLFETTVANRENVDGPADPDTVFRWLVDVVDTYTSHPAYLHVGGRPVVLAYAAQRMSQAGWREALSRLRASGRDVLLVGEGINSTRLGALDGLFFYPSNAFQGDDIRAFDLTQSTSVRTYHLLPGDTIGRRIWVATVSPGYDDTHLNDGRVARVSDRDGGRYYVRQWQSAVDMRADWIVVTSWNEWFENTHIEPSARYGTTYVTLTKEWADRFRRSHAVAR
jgi:glycosyl hydrolase family 99